MFKGIVNWFTSNGVAETASQSKGEQEPFGIAQGENTMTNTARILPVTGNKFALFAGGRTVGTYSRKRDAVRGAQRRGLTVA